MTLSEELDHKRVQAVYLRKLLECVNEEISELEQDDPYAELKAAHAAGKRIAWRYGNAAWEITRIPEWNPTFHYKIVDDEEITKYFYFAASDQYSKVRVTKCALTGKISAEVVE